MSKVRVNYKSDLPPVSVKFSINGSEVDVPDNDFAVRFFVDGAPGTSFICTHKKTVNSSGAVIHTYTNCSKTDDSTLTCYIDNHKFGCGRLCCEFVDMTPNQAYSDKVQKTVTPAILDVVLVDGAGDDNVEVLNATFNFEPNEIVSIFTEESQLDGGTNIVTITQSNGETSVFGVKNGKKGEKGDPGRNGVYINLDTGEEEVPEFNIIDDLVTGGSTDALSAEQGKILGEIVSPLVDVYSYDSSDLEDGWWGLDLDIGDTVGSKNKNPSDHKYKCTRLLVSAGDVIEVDTQGRWQARPWAITDRDRELLSVSERIATPVQERFSIEQDGYFYVNCVADPETASDPVNYLSSFSVTHTVNNAPLVKKIPKIDKRVASMYDVDEYDSNDLVDKWVWRNALSAVHTRKYREHANNHASMHIDVKCGDTVTVRTRAYTMRHSSQPEGKTAYEVVGWAITDTEKNILSAANPTDSVTTTTLHIEQDGAVYMNCANDSASLSIFSVTHTYGKTNRQVEKLEALTDVLKGDTDHLIAMYYGRSSREKWTPSTLKDVLTHTHTIGNRKGCTDWFFSSLLYVEFVTSESHKLCPNSAPGGRQYRPSTKEDWVWLMDRFFSNAEVEVRGKNEHEGLRGLDDAIEELKGTMGTPPRRHKVVLTIPIPYYHNNKYDVVTNKRTVSTNDPTSFVFNHSGGEQETLSEIATKLDTIDSDYHTFFYTPANGGSISVYSGQTPQSGDKIVTPYKANHWGTLSRSDIPDFNDEWMDIFDVHQTLNFDTGQTAAANYRTLANNDHREIVMKWYIDKAIARFNAENYENIDLAGFYWVDETLEYPLNSGNRDAIVGDIAEYIHDKGMKLYWIPYNTAVGRFDADETHIDETYLQTGYFWKDGKLKDDGINYRDLMMKGTMEYLYKEAVTQGCGLEFEMSSFLFPDFTSSLRFSSMTQTQLDNIGASLTNIDSDFMDRLETLTGVFEDEHYFWRRHIAYYLDNNMILAMAMSPNERVRRFMDRLAEIVNDKDIPASAVSTALDGKQDTLISGTNIKTINHQSLLGSGNITIQGGGGGGGITVDDVITEDSTNPVTSAAIYSSLQGVETKLPLVVNIEENNGVVTCDTSIADIYAAYSAGRDVVGHVNQGQVNLFICIENAVAFYWIYGNAVNYIFGSTNNNNNVDSWSHDIVYIQYELTFDSTPTANSSNPVESGGVKTALDGKQDTLVSGTSIKTINSSSILGSGNVDLLTPSFCPIIEDTRSSAVAAITGVAPFSTLVDGQRIMLFLANYYNASNSTLTLTLSGGGRTSAIPIYAQTASSNTRPQASTMAAGAYFEMVYVSSSNRWQVVGKDTNTTYTTLSQATINIGTEASGRVITAALVHDNCYIVEESYSSGSLKANKIYDFGTVSTALTIPSLDATNDLVSNALNFYALRFIAGADNLSITFPTGVEVDNTPTINTGDYVEIMINLYVENSNNHFYASIKVWQAQ